MLNQDAVNILSRLLQDGVAGDTPSPFSAAGAGARDVKRLTWSSGLSDKWEQGRAAQGFLLFNDGLADAYIAFNSAGLPGGLGAILTVKAGTWIALPIVTSVLFAGGDNDDGTLLVLAFDYAPTPAAGVIFAGTSSPDAQHTVIGDSSAGVLALARNAARREAILVNATGHVLYVLYGDHAAISSTVYTIQVPDGETLIIDNYTGDIAVKGTAAANGIQVTEIASRP